MNQQLAQLLDSLFTTGDTHDATEPEHSRRMLNITPDTGQLLWILVRAVDARQILEVGTSNAYSTIWFADAVAPLAGHVTTLERSADKIALAETNLTEANLRDHVDIIEGDALTSLATLSGPYDLIFLDADRPNYLNYLPLLVDRLRPGGLLVTDNIVSHAHELEQFIAAVQSDERLATVTVPIGKGEEISLRL